MIKAKYFSIEELVDRETFEKRGDKAWQLIDDRLIYMIDALREKFGPITINNWKTGGDREWSGLRTSKSPYYSPYSQHTFGRAADMVFKSALPDAVRMEILDNKDKYPYITGVELDISWVHIDIRNAQQYYTFKP